MKKILAGLLLSLVSSQLFADSISVNLKSNKNSPVFQAVVYLEPMTSVDFPKPEAVSVMDQIDSQFVPHILAVQRGSLVSFPNSDSIKHHVYSFSPTNTFELQLYKGLKAAPLPFEKQGEVELGCNVHDWMLGYILVVDTPYFAKTDQKGTVEIDVPSGEYRLKVWHPRIQDDEVTLAQTVNIAGEYSLDIKLKRDLLEDLTDFESNQDEFSDYD